MPAGGKRDVLRLALRELHRAAPAPTDIVPLPAGAPFGAVELNVEGCTLCLACVSACPTGALWRTPSGRCCASPRTPACNAGCARRPARRRSSRLKPQIDFRAATAARARAQGRRAVRLHPLQQAVRRQKHDRARLGQARRQALDVQGLGAAARRHQDVRGLPRGGDGGTGFRPLWCAAAAARAPPKTICASARKSSAAARVKAQAFRACLGCPRSEQWTGWSAFLLP